MQFPYIAYLNPLYMNRDLSFRICGFVNYCQNRDAQMMRIIGGIILTKQTLLDLKLWSGRTVELY